MKKIVLIGFSVILTWLLYSKSKKISESRNSIDALEHIAREIKEKKLINKYVYFYTNIPFEKNKKLYFQTQFALAPKVVIRAMFEDIPKDSLILYVQEKKRKRKMPKPIRKLNDTLHYSDNNEDIRYIILKK